MSGIAIPPPMALQLTDASQQAKGHLHKLLEYHIWNLCFILSLTTFWTDKSIGWSLSVHDSETNTIHMLLSFNSWRNSFSHLCTKYIKNTQSFLWWWQTQLLFGFLDMGQHYFFRIIWLGMFICPVIWTMVDVPS